MAEIIDIMAVYNGPPAMIYESFKQSDITVTAIYENSSYNFIIPNSNITVSTLQAINSPVQECTVHYYDTETKKKYSTKVNIPVLYPVKLVAEYTGDYIYIIDKFEHSDVDVYIEYNYSEYNTKLDDSQYKINSYNVTSLGPNTFIVTEKVLKKNNISTEVTIYGIRKILEMRIKYVGDPIEVTSSIDPNDLLVEVETANEYNDDKFTMLLKYNEEVVTVGDDEFTFDFYIDEPLTIDTVGNNVKTIHFKNPLIDLQQEIIITGIPKVIDFQTTYIGNKAKEGMAISSENVCASITLLLNANTDEQTIQTIEYGEWDFYDAPIIQSFNKGVIKTQYKDFLSTITVPYDVEETLRLRCWYEGGKIEIGNRFPREAVIAYIIDEYGNSIPLDTYELIFLDDTLVTENGWNFYKIQAKNVKQKTIGTYAVPGYTPLHKNPDKEFKVVYIDTKNDNQEIDYTREFLEGFTMEDTLIINWETFFEIAHELNKLGLYIMTVPKAHGLSIKYDEDWEVLCESNTLKSNIIRTYNEEDETWQNRRQQQQTMSKWWKVPIIQY